MRRFEVIEDHSLYTGILRSDSRVLDLGANAGRFTQAIVERFGCEVIAVEPNPEMFDQIAPHPRVLKLPYAMTASTGPVEFHISDFSLGSSLGRPSGQQQNTITVLGKNLEELIREVGWSRIDLLKMDIEGAEIDVFGSCADRILQSIAQMTIEFHDFTGAVSTNSIRKLLRRLESLGFRFVSRYRGCFYDTWLVNCDACDISMLEYYWIQHGLRNFWGVRRKVAKLASWLGTKSSDHVAWRDLS